MGFAKKKTAASCMCARSAITFYRKIYISGICLANGFWVGDMPRTFDGATVIWRAAANAARVIGHEIALESKKVRSIPGSAHCSLRGTSVFYTNDSCSVGQELPVAATSLLDMFTIVLAGKTTQLSHS